VERLRTSVGAVGLHADRKLGGDAPPVKAIATRMRPATVVAVLVTVAAGADRWLRATTFKSIPSTPVPLTGLFKDASSTAVTTSAAGQHAPWFTTEGEVRDSVELWKRMHLEDWNGVPSPRFQ
jgi:hypothetical protein